MGGDTQIKCELNLLREAIKGNYEYYHLISGVDLPVKSQDYIHRFFDLNKGKNYLSIDWKSVNQQTHLDRMREYHFLQNRIGRNTGHLVGMLSKLENLSLRFQRRIGADRLKDSPKVFYKGANWFSITHEMASVVLSEMAFIRKYCFYSLCADEVFLQTIAMNSNLKDTIVFDSLRCIDWERGSPYTYTSEDFDMLMNSSALFARKFSDNTDSNITTRIVNEVT